MSITLVRLHRWLGLALLAFWLVQAISGTLLAFRWEIEDMLLPGSSAPAEPAALGAQLDAITAAGGTSADVWASSDASTRYDIYYRDAGGAERVRRVDGAGRVLRDAPSAGLIANGAIFDTLTLVHTRLLAGEFGSWIVAISGALLFAQLIVGLYLGWPRAGNWRRAMLVRPKGSPSSRLYGWHRLLGIWLGPLILSFVAAGILLCFEDGLRLLVDQEIPTPVAAPGEMHIRPGEALAIAAEQHPGSRLSALILATEDAPWYRVRQLRPGDLRRNWGTSTLFVSATDGSVLGDYPSSEAPNGRRLIDLIYPFHTGQLAGPIGRAAVLLQGILLATLLVLGLRLWQRRRGIR